MLACFGIICVANADEKVKRTCPVYGTKYTATLAHGSTMVSDEDSSVTIIVEGPEDPSGDHFVTVWVNALDRSTKCIIQTIKVVVTVKRDESKASNGADFFRNLPKGYYDVSIDNATCDK